MELSISYDELTALLEKKTGKVASIQYVDDRAINIGFTAKVPLIGTKHFGINLSVSKIVDDDIYLCFGKMASMAISGLLGMINDRTFIEKQDDAVIIHIGQIEKAKGVLEFFALKNVSFSENKVNVELGVKE